MKNLTGKISTAALALMISASSAMAQSAGAPWWQSWFNSWWGGWSRPTPGGGGQVSSRVPEIDASTGLLAMAAVTAAVLLAWEVNRRRKRG
jgi:hypothetical protein